MTTRGRLILEYNNKFINIDKFISKGDVVIHAPDILHKVEKSNQVLKKLCKDEASSLLPVTQTINI